MNAFEEPTDVDLIKTKGHYIDEAAAIVLLLREDETVGFINKAGCKLLGYSRKEILGANWFDTFLPANVQSAARKYFRSFFDRKPEEGKIHENMVLTKGGEIRHIKWSSVYLQDSDGTPEGILGSGLDVTDKRTLQIYLAQQDAEKRKQILSASIEAQEQERQHISHELHDNVGQLLTTCKLVLDVEISRNAPRFCKRLSIICSWLLILYVPFHIN